MQIGGSSFDIPLPVQLSLPIDELQRRAEELEFSELLDQVLHPSVRIERKSNQVLRFMHSQ